MCNFLGHHIGHHIGMAHMPLPIVLFQKIHMQAQHRHSIFVSCNPVAAFMSPLRIMAPAYIDVEFHHRFGQETCIYEGNA